jgi:spermidine synthase
MSKAEWFAEQIVPGVRVAYEGARVLVRERTEHQEMALIDNEPFGHVMILDSATQVTSADEFMYHEMLGHVPLLAHGAAVDVLIIGGGDCGLAEEVLKHRGVRRLTQVEIDGTVVDFARRHLGDINAGVFTDPRFDLQIGDGAAFVASTDQRFDVGRGDSSDPVGPAKVLFTAEFYGGVRRCL